MSDPDIGILKTIWTKNEEKRWAIHGIKGIDLKPREGQAPTFFKIQDELCLLTDRPGPVMDSLFSTFGGTEFLVRQSIVPVVSWFVGDEAIRCIGTGFFVSATGLLLTAAHVIRDPIDEGYAALSAAGPNSSRLSEGLSFGILLPVNPAMRDAPFGNFPRQLREARFLICPFEYTQHWGKDVTSPLLGSKTDFALDLDIAVCKVREFPILGPYQPLNIGKHRLNLGDRAVAIGYAEMTDIVIAGGEQPELVVSVGSVTSIHPDNVTERRNLTPGPNFEFDAKVPGKMSGSPVLVGSGIVTKGVVSRSWQGENLASGCLIAAAMDISLHNGETLSQLQRSGNAGIARISGPDL